MKRLCLALPRAHAALGPIDKIVAGETPVSGTIGAILRLADALSQAGHAVTLSAAQPLLASPWPSLLHDALPSLVCDHIILHQSFLSSETLSLWKAPQILWLHNRTSWEAVDTFLQQGGQSVVVPSRYLAEVYRAVPRWNTQIVMIPHFPSPAFHPEPEIPLQRLLFVGAVTPDSGFRDVMRLGSALATRAPALQLAIAGSIQLHASGPVGALGVGTPEFEAQEIQPWLADLPRERPPVFLGALPPVRLRREIARSWAVLVNPSWDCPETFCLSAVEAQACGRPVFSVAAGALPETICRRPFDPLATSRGVDALATRVQEALAQPGPFRMLGQESIRFVQQTFSRERVVALWQDLLQGRTSSLACDWPPETERQWIYEFLRRTGLGMRIHHGGGQ